jgi:hypothetical protein
VAIKVPDNRTRPVRESARYLPDIICSFAARALLINALVLQVLTQNTAELSSVA